MDPRELRLIQIRSQNLPGCLRSQLRGEMHKKTVNVKQYHWCPKHESWTHHLPQDCRKLLTNKPSTDKSKGKEAGSKFSPSPKKSKNPKMKLSKALQTVMEANLEDEVASDSGFRVQILGTTSMD